ncbi:MAG: general secretion pathway protein GspB, partial [Desulfobulbales bacterium]|nr:general secretion pathway protein GspB [Desulfobulbales bacterium]
ADTGRQKTQPGIILMVIGGGVACGLVILAGWWLFSAKSQGPPGAITQIPQQKVPLEEAVPVAPVEPETPPSPVISAEPAWPPIDISALPRPKVQATEPTAVKLPAPSVSAVAQKEPLPAGETAPVKRQAPQRTIKAAPPPALEAAEDAPAEDVAAATSATPPALRAETEVVEIPLLKDRDIKLQAVTWSRNPSKRIAVINNRILRQGETVRGYIIDTINQDDVILSNKGEQWKLLFRIN